MTKIYEYFEGNEQHYCQNEVKVKGTATHSLYPVYGTIHFLPIHAPTSPVQNALAVHLKYLNLSRRLSVYTLAYVGAILRVLYVLNMCHEDSSLLKT